MAESTSSIAKCSLRFFSSFTREIESVPSLGCYSWTSRKLVPTDSLIWVPNSSAPLRRFVDSRESAHREKCADLRGSVSPRLQKALMSIYGPA